MVKVAIISTSAIESPPREGNSHRVVAIKTRKRSAHKLASDFGFIHRALFISLKLGTYVIRDFTSGGYSELNERLVRESRRFV